MAFANNQARKFGLPIRKVTCAPGLCPVSSVFVQDFIPAQAAPALMSSYLAPINSPSATSQSPNTPFQICNNHNTEFQISLYQLPSLDTPPSQPHQERFHQTTIQVSDRLESLRAPGPPTPSDETGLSVRRICIVCG